MLLPVGPPYHVPNFNKMTMRSWCWEAWKIYSGDGQAQNCQTNGRSFFGKN